MIKRVQEAVDLGAQFVHQLNTQGLGAAFMFFITCMMFKMKHPVKKVIKFLSEPITNDWIYVGKIQIPIV